MSASYFDCENNIKSILDLMQKLTSLLNNPQRIKQVERDLQIMKAGHEGERKVAHQLKASLTDDYYLINNLRIQDVDDVSVYAEIDHILVSRKILYVIESKALSSDLLIDEEMNWHTKRGSTTKNIHSPIEQNRIHVKLLVDNIKKLENLSFNGYKLPVLSMVCLSNLNCNVENKSGNATIEKQIIRIDNLYRQIKATESKIAEGMSDDTVKRLAKALMSLHKPAHFNLIYKYNLTPENFKDSKLYAEFEAECKRVTVKTRSCKLCHRDMILSGSTYLCKGFPICNYTESAFDN